MTISRSATSQVPATADSAAVRVWHPTAGTNSAKYVEIPDPGATTQVTFTVPVRSGYSVGVIAYRRDPDAGLREGLAGGRADNVAVAAGSPTTVQINPVPWRVELNSPSSMVSGEQTTIMAEITQGPITDFLLTDTRLFLSTQQWSSLASLPTSRLAIRSGNQMTWTFAAPTVDESSMAWIQFALQIDHLAWETASQPILIFSPSFTFGESLYQRPITVPSGSIIVNFHRRS